MNIETPRDILHWMREFHRQLLDRMDRLGEEWEKNCANKLLEYLCDHESRLISVLDEFERKASLNRLNNCSYEYVEQHPGLCYSQISKPLEQMTVTDLIGEVSWLHNQIIDFYRFLLQKNMANIDRSLLSQLWSIRDHEFLRFIGIGVIQEPAK